MEITKEQIDILDAIQQEIVKCFNSYEDRINQKLQVVAIQDLDFWQGQLAQTLRKIKRDN